LVGRSRLQWWENGTTTLHHLTWQKLPILNHKSQIIFKFKFIKLENLKFGSVVIGALNLFSIWSLGFRISSACSKKASASYYRDYIDIAVISVNHCNHLLGFGIFRKGLAAGYSWTILGSTHLTQSPSGESLASTRSMNSVFLPAMSLKSTV